MSGRPLVWSLLSLALATAAACTHGPRESHDPEATTEPEPAELPPPTEAVSNAHDAAAAAEAARTAQHMPAPQEGRSPAGQPSDEDLVQSIRGALLLQPAMKSVLPQLSIRARGGQVTLEGPVRTEEQRAFVDAVARGTDGVRGVDDRLRVVAH